MRHCVLTLISVFFVVIFLVLPGGADSGLVTISSTKPIAAMELFGHPVSGVTAITPVTAATEICFPHFADGPSWWTGIAVANPGQSPALVTMRAYNDNGVQLGQDFIQIIPPQSQMAPAVIHNLFSLGDTETGWIKLVSSQPVVTLEIFGHTNSGGIAGFSPAAAATEICIPHFVEDGDWWTGIAVANPGSVVTQVSISVFSDAGNQIGDPYVATIAGGCRLPPQIVRNLVSLGEHTSGWLKINATQPVVAMEIFGQASTSMIAGLAAGSMGTDLYYPYFQEGSGNWTGIAIANLGGSETQVTLKAVNGAGETVGMINSAIPASGRMTPQAITGLFGSLDNETGYVEVNAKQPIAGLGLLGGAGWLAGYTAVTEKAGAFAFPHFADSDGWWTKIALVNSSDDTATLSMAAYGVDGTLVGDEKNIECAPSAALVEILPFSESTVDPAAEVSKTVGIAGGTLTVTSPLGDDILLEIPLGALLEETEITLRSLAVPLSDPIAKNVFPGVQILPEGTTFLVPAKLKVVFAKPLESGSIALLYQVKNAEFIVPLDDLIISEASVEGYISHLSDYGAGEPSPSEAQALADLADAMIPPYDPYGHAEAHEALSYALSIKEGLLLLGGEDPYPQNIEKAVLEYVKNFLAEPRPEPPCDPDYIAAVFAYFKMMALLGLPVFDDQVKNQEVEAVRQQLSDLISEVVSRCSMQYNLFINIDMILDVGLEKNYNEVINLGCFSGDTGVSVYGTGILPLTGGGQFGAVTTEVSGSWYVIASGNIELKYDENNLPVDLIMHLTISGEVLEMIDSYAGDLLVSATTSDYHQDKTFTIPVRNLNSQVEIEHFSGGLSISTLTLEQVDDPMAQ